MESGRQHGDVADRTWPRRRRDCSAPIGPAFFSGTSRPANSSADPRSASPGDELRIADDAGIVGQVIKTGEPRRLGRADDRREVNRRVDAALHYQTDTLLCVPLRGKRGDLFGAFEAINKLKGEFTPDDEAALVELAAHASIALENTQERERLLESRNDNSSIRRPKACN